MARKSREKPSKPNRTRAVPIQVYVSDVERHNLQELVRQRNVSVSELVRVWIRGALAASAAKRDDVTAVDPRQVELF
jgi:hypothetical protein